MKASFNFTAGILLCGEIRHYLRKEQFCGRDIQFMEGRGWLEREFTVTGSSEDLDHVLKVLENYQKVVDGSLQDG